MSCPFGPSHPEFVVTMLPNGICDLAACWDSTDVRKISKDLRELADTLDEMPEDYQAVGVRPLV